MPQRRSILDKPEGSGQRPSPMGHSDPGAPESQILDFLTGLVSGDAEPGNVPGGIGSMAALLPISKILQKLLRNGSKAARTGDQMLRNHDVVPEELVKHIETSKANGRMGEFAPVDATNTRNIKDNLGPSPGNFEPYKGPDTSGWPGQADIEALKLKLRKPE